MPEGPTTPENTNLSGEVQQRTSTANYESRIKKEIAHDNISILIICETISKSKKQELLRIFTTYILNTERGDNIEIVSRSDFNKLE